MLFHAITRVKRLLSALLILLVSHVVNAAEPAVYSIMIVPQWRPVVVERNWTPFLAELSRRTGIKFKMLSPHSIPDFETLLLDGKADFAYMNPYHALIAKRKHGYIPLVRNGNKPLHGILVALKGSGLTSIQQLDGKTISFPSPNAFGASLYMRALLDKQEHIRINPRYVNTHANVYRSVVFMDVIAGGGVDKTLAKENPALQEKLEVIYKTPGVAPHPFCVHPRVPANFRNKVQQAILAMWQDPMGKKLLQNVQLALPVKADYQRDYAPLEKLGLEKYAE